MVLGDPRVFDQRAWSWRDLVVRGKGLIVVWQQWELGHRCGGLGCMEDVTWFRYSEDSECVLSYVVPRSPQRPASVPVSLSNSTTSS